MKIKPIPPREILNRHFDFDCATGTFRWKARGFPKFDNKMAGRPAFATIVNGYCVGTVPGYGRYQAHRIAYFLATGREPCGEVDHINGDRRDNRPSNLRVVTASENRRNAAVPSHNTSGLIGVSYRGDKRRWRAYIAIGDITQHLGYFNTKTEALAARKAAEQEHGFHPNHGRIAQC